MRKFKRAQAVNQASIERHLRKQSQDSSSDEENDGNNDNNEILQQAVNKILSSYQGEGGDTEKTLAYLSELFQSGGAVCLICISSVKKADAIWSCQTCFSCMHLTCIQHWIRDSLSYKHQKGIKPLWACPKCRKEYPESEVPSTYLCFCGKTTDPLSQPWSIPHSCGESCEKWLQPSCGHRCLLLCHPGPCPSCPKMVQISCYCSKSSPQPRRCNSKLWSCGLQCNKLLSCQHYCQEYCHSGSCPPCSTLISVPCNCGSQISTRKCQEAIWSCDQPCNRLFPCKAHHCSGVCHLSEDCGDCLLAKNRTCPCGKKKYEVSCTQKTVSTCGDTCGKLLDCKSHYCNQRCHPDNCGQCLEVVQKTCKCGSFTKEVACAKDFHCTKKCTQLRLCGRHPCNKKCCDCIATDSYNFCERICENTLNCRKHKCPAPCHSGPCYPCPRTVDISCRCGGSKITVPCGTKRIKPPKCKKMCKVPPNCHHSKRESHKCHQGPCPPCKKICELVYKRCRHDCKAVCHTNVWVKVLVNGVHQPSGPWETPQEKMQLQTLPCPSCEVSVMVTCLGGHETKPWPCYRAIPNSCLRSCGQMLPCGNHRCELECHRIKKVDGTDSVGGNIDGKHDKPAKKLDAVDDLGGPDVNLDGPGDDINNPGFKPAKKQKIKIQKNPPTDCMPCELPCELPRTSGCLHLCPLPCHPAPCPSCRQLVKIPCHCGINSLYKRCCELTAASLELKNELLKCGNQCPRCYSCGHRCVDDCHPGPCRSGENCNKKVKIGCKCMRLKKNLPCVDVQRGLGILQCDEQCEKLKLEKQRAAELELAKKLKEEELRNQREIEKFERKFKPRRKMKEKVHNDNADDKNRFRMIMMIIVGILMSIFGAFIVYLMKKL